MVTVTGTTEGAPAYRRVGDLLAARMRSSELAPGARVPSERDLATEQGISHMTVRAAVDLLARRRLVERKERSGVFVARPKIEQSLDTAAGFSDQLESRGVAPGAQVLQACTVQSDDLGDAEVASRMWLWKGDRVHMVVRVRTGDGEPLVLEENYLPERLLPGLRGEGLTGGLYALMGERYGLFPAHHSRQELEPTMLDPGAADVLGASPDAPALRVTRLAWDAQGRPIGFARELHRGDRLLFVSEV